MTEQQFQIRQLADEIQPPESGKQSIVLTDDDNAKVVLFAFAAGDGLKEHVAPLPAIIQIIKGEAELTVGEEAVAGKAGNVDSDGCQNTPQHQGNDSIGHAADVVEIAPGRIICDSGNSHAKT